MVLTNNTSNESLLVQPTINAQRFGLKATKRGKKIERNSRKANKQQKRDGDPVSEIELLGSKATPVSIDPSIKRVYRVIDQKSFLVWGLSSDWMVPSTPSSSSSASAPCTRSAVRLPLTRCPQPSPPGGAARDNASEGYGEMTAGSIQHLINHLVCMHMHLPDHLARNGHSQGAKAATFWNLTPESTFLDIGSGYGKVVFHFALAGAAAWARGVEYVPSRAAVANEVLAEVKQWSLECSDPLTAQRLERVELLCGDATKDPLISTSHIYIYDKVFSDETIERIAVILNCSPVRVFVSYQRPDTWRRLGLSEKYIVSESFPMRTTGNQNFRCHIFVNVC